MVKRLGYAVLLTGLILSFCPVVHCSPLTLEQRYRLKKYLPKTFAKLEGRDPVHVVLLGDGNLNAFSPDEVERVSGDALNGFPGVFLHKLAAEFFYTGGVRQLNPPDGAYQKRDQSRGPEIRFENLAEAGASVLSGIQRVRSDVLLNNPDLVIIQYGATDALNRMSMFTFRRALHEILQICRQSGADVILLGPTPVNEGGGAADWGITRPFVTASRGMAKAHEVMFMDTGSFLIRSGGAADPDADPMAGTALIGDKLKRIFFVAERTDAEAEIQYLNAKAHDDVGRKMFHELIHGPEVSDFSAAGTAAFGEKGMVRAVISIRNQSDNTKRGILGAFSVGGLKPVTASQRYVIEPGKSQELTFDYVRPVVGKSESRSDIIYPLEVDDEAIRFSFLIEDGVKTEFLDLPLRAEPISISWKSQQFINITNQIRVEWEFVSGVSRPINGTYRLGMGGGVDKPRAFRIAPLGRERGAANLRFGAPSGVDCFQTDISLEVEIGGHTYRFNREMEASRDLVLGEKAIMASSNYISAAAGKSSVRRGDWSPTVHFDAVVDEQNPARSGLFGIVDLSGLQIPNMGNSPAVRAVMTVDARGPGKARDFGAVTPVVIYFKGSGGRGFVPSLPVGAFGETYNLQMAPEGVTSLLKNNQLQVRIPQSYLARHNWNIGDSGLMGVKMEVSIADPASQGDPFSLRRTFISHYPRLIFKEVPVRGMTAEDSQGLTTLRFSRQPVNSWSVRIY